MCRRISWGPRQREFAMKWQQLQIPIILILVMYITVSLLIGGTDEEPLPSPGPTRTPRPTFESVASRDSGPVARIVLPTNTLPPTWTPFPSPTVTAVPTTRTPKPSPTERPTTRPPLVTTDTSTPHTPRPSATRTNTPRPTQTATQTPTRTPRPSPSATRTVTPLPETHTVQKGESLTSIALLYNTSVDALVQTNGLRDPNSIQIGQVLAVPGAAQPTSTATAGQTAAATRAATPRPTVRATAGADSTITHTVQKGETLSGVASLYGVTVQEIVDANGLESADLLQIGQVLIIPLPPQASPTTPTPSSTPKP